MLGHLKSELKASLNFPSPPAIAQQIIAQARDPHTDISQLAATVGRDPALAARLLRGANSVLYSRQRKSANLRQALMVLGLQGATTLALGFSLVHTYRGLTSNSVDSERYWRRALLSASAARCFGALQNPAAMDDIFLAALLQDIAILGVDRTAPDFYRDLPPNASHREISEYETGRLGIDHAELGAWLLQYWRLPEPLCRAVAWSHVPPIADPSTPTGSAACCIALGSECAELLLAPAAASEFSPLADRASEWMGIEAPVVTQVIGQVVVTTAEIERLFDMSLLQPAAASVILARARELLIPGPRQASGRPSAAQTTELTADMGTAAPNDTLRRDGLTGLYNRGYLDLLLRREFQAATNGHWPLSLVFVDLDRFKGINETYGHEAGDAVLVTTAKTIASVARDTDCVARYGGTEFVILLPGLASNGAEIFCERLIAGLRSTLHTIRDTAVTVTASVGLASHAPEKPFQRASHLIDAAERSAYFAKRSGRDRLVRHRSGGPTSVAKR